MALSVMSPAGSQWYVFAHERPGTSTSGNWNTGGLTIVLRGDDDGLGTGTGDEDSRLSSPGLFLGEASVREDCAEDRASIARRERMQSSSSEFKSESGIMVLVEMSTTDCK